MKNIHKISISALVLIPALLSAQSILIDFGDASTQTTGLSDYWNNLAIDTSAGGDTSDLSATGFNLMDTTNTGTGITLNITNAFEGRNANGAGSAFYPASAQADSFYTATSTAGVTPGDGLGIIEFTGLDSSKTYTFTMFASRAATNNRETQYTFNGAINEGDNLLNDATVFLNTASNTTNTVTASSISPTAGGVITLTVEAGPNNESDYSYLGVVEIAVIPEPGAFALLLGAMATSLVMLRRRS